MEIAARLIPSSMPILPSLKFILTISCPMFLGFRRIIFFLFQRIAVRVHIVLGAMMHTYPPA